MSRRGDPAGLDCMEELMLYIKKAGYGHVGWLMTREQALSEPGVERDAGVRSRELMYMPYPEYLKTPEWNVTRKRALKDAGHRCQLCNKVDLLEVHHRTYERRGVELPSDVIALCADCHQVFHDNREVVK